MITGSTPWTVVEGKFVSQKRRCVYIACYAKATCGSVCFDDVTLVKE